MIKKFLIILAVLLLIIATAFIFYNNKKVDKDIGGRIQNVPAAPSVTCSIDAEVFSVENKKTETGEYYLVKVDISNISTFDYSGVGSCDEDFIKTVEKEGIIQQSQGYESNPLIKGQKIKANVSFGGDERFNGYFFGNITNL